MDLASHRSLLAAAAAAAALAVAGCGDDEEETDTAAEEPPTEQPETGDAAPEGEGGAASSVEVSGVDFAFEPENPVIEEDGPVEITLTNDGELPHALVIEETEDGTDTIDGGEETTLTAELDSGEYTIFCPVGDHRQQGMEGTLTVGGGGDGAGDEPASGDEDGAAASDDGAADSGGGY